MRRNVLLGTSSIIAFALLASGADAQEGKSLDAPGWFKNYEEGRANARETGKPMFVVIR